MGVASLMLTVLAFSAPIAVVEGFIPFAIYFGGPGATFAFVLTTLTLLLFAIGYVAMAKHVDKPGAFYAFITTGLGKIPGLGAAFLAIFGYLSVLGGTYVFLGTSTSSLIQSLGGSETHWAIWALLGWVAVSTLGYFHIEMSAKILSFAMVFEVLIVMIFNIFVLFAKAPAGELSITPFTPSAFMGGDMSVTLLYTVLVFMGFEATALFRDEVHTPHKTIPRATYGAVLFVGILYTLSCYSLISAYGASAWDMAKENPTEMFAHAIGQYVAPVFTQITYASVVISIFAALLSIHNVLSRYVLNLAADKALPTKLASIHKQHNSPHAASVAITVVMGIILVLAWLSGREGASLYGLVVGIGGIGVIILMALVSLAIIFWFIKRGVPEGENRFKTFVAPAIAGMMLTFTAVFACMHLDLVVGGEPHQNDWIIWALIGVFIMGSVLAIYFKFSQPHIYKSLGRTDIKESLLIENCSTEGMK
ncbi:APC family permease [Acinetobacter tandoii]|nr:APC family permease [Acinetobacter tandoii]